MRRLRVVRRRIAAVALALFLAAWLAVAALGKGGSTGTATTGSPTTGAPSQGDDGSSSGADSGSSQGSGQQGGPVTTGQS